MEEAREIKARAVIMAVPHRRAAGSPFGRTIETVLADRPCRVIITTERVPKRSETLPAPA